jgi:hypothetical protein
LLITWGVRIHNAHFFNQITMRKFDKYLTNLSIVHYDGADYIQSYNTRVAKIDYATGTAKVLAHWSVTTTKHINYACNQLRLTQIK